MADGDEDNEGAQVSSPVGGRKKRALSGKRIVLMALTLLLVMGGGTALVWFFLSGSSVESSVQEEEAKGHVFLDLDPITVNVSSAGTRPRYLKISLTLQLKNTKDQAALVELEPKILDSFQTVLRESRVEDLQGSKGVYYLKESLLALVNRDAYPLKVEDVLIKKMLVQ